MQRLIEVRSGKKKVGDKATEGQSRSAPNGEGAISLQVMKPGTVENLEVVASVDVEEVAPIVYDMGKKAANSKQRDRQASEAHTKWSRVEDLPILLPQDTLATQGTGHAPDLCALPV